MIRGASAYNNSPGPGVIPDTSAFGPLMGEPLPDGRAADPPSRCAMGARRLATEASEPVPIEDRGDGGRAADPLRGSPCRARRSLDG
jgi:hypothetical protein